MADRSPIMRIVDKGIDWFLGLDNRGKVDVLLSGALAYLGYEWMDVPGEGVPQTVLKLIWGPVGYHLATVDGGGSSVVPSPSQMVGIGMLGTLGFMGLDDVGFWNLLPDIPGMIVDPADNTPGVSMPEDPSNPGYNVPDPIYESAVRRGSGFNVDRLTCPVDGDWVKEYPAFQKESDKAAQEYIDHYLVTHI